MAYDSALDAQQRLFVDARPGGKTSKRSSHLEQYRARWRKVLACSRAGRFSRWGEEYNCQIESIIQAQESERQRLSGKCMTGLPGAFKIYLAN